MALLDRINAALTPRRIQRIERKAGATLLWPESRKRTPYQWIVGDYEVFAREGYEANAIIYSAIMYKARAQMAAPLRAYMGEKDAPEPLDAAHPLAQLVARPNRYQSWSEFQSLSEVYFNISGNSYIWVDRDEKGLPRRLLPLRPDHVWHMPNAKRDALMGFLYVPEGASREKGVPILAEDMIHVKLPNPLDPFDGLGPGMSPLAPTALAVDVDNSVSRFLFNFFKTGAIMAGLLKFKDALDPGDVQRIKERWKEQYGGYEHWGEIGVLDSSGEYQILGQTFDQMGIDAIDSRNEHRMVAPLGVPLGLLQGDASKYANYETAKRQFWQDTFLPELKMFEEEYRYYLGWPDGAWVAFDTSEIQELKIDLLPIVQAWQILAGEGVSAADAATTVGLKLILTEPIDKPKPMPFGFPPAAPDKPATTPDEEDAEPEATDQADEEGAAGDKAAIPFPRWPGASR